MNPRSSVPSIIKRVVELINPQPPGSGPSHSAVKVFIAYSHKDSRLHKKLENHLSLMQRQGIIELWHDRRISPGTEWKGQIDDNLNTADIILLLISADFMASNYCYDVEMKRAMERHQRGKARVIPIILRPYDWKRAPFGILQALPKDGQAVTTWSNRDEAFLDVANGIRRAIEDLTKRNPSVNK